MSNETSTESSGESFGEIVRTIFYALLIAIIFRTFFFQAFTIPSGSMKPTLLVGDYLLVSKYSYGYTRFSFPFGSRMPSDLLGGRVFEGLPERGDVIVFRNPRENRKDFIKRVIGLPGDRVEVVGGVLVVNGAPAQQTPIEPFIEENGGERCPRNTNGPGVSCTRVLETLDNGVSHETLVRNAGALSYADNTCSYVVPEGHYFFLGDNRNNSEDSRFGHAFGTVDCSNLRPGAPRNVGGRGPGYIPADHMIGRAEIILLSSEGAFWEFWNWRGDRFFRSID